MEMVTAADGTSIAYARAGAGPPLVIVHGSGQDHTRWATSLPGLTRQTSVYAIDRRGRGGSEDTAEYALDHEVNDLLAVLDAIDHPVFLLGHSYGAIIALEAALCTDRVRRLILYEPPINVGREQSLIELGDRLAALMATGDREAVLVTFLEEAGRYPPDSIAAQRRQPEWPARLA
jgi:pimeloyl-ACP methyl ester carboxylesterase